MHSSAASFISSLLPLPPQPLLVISFSYHICPLYMVVTQRNEVSKGRKARPVKCKQLGYTRSARLVSLWRTGSSVGEGECRRHGKGNEPLRRTPLCAGSRARQPATTPSDDGAGRGRRRETGRSRRAAPGTVEDRSVARANEGDKARYAALVGLVGAVALALFVHGVL